jgi:transposase
VRHKQFGGEQFGGELMVHVQFEETSRVCFETAHVSSFFDRDLNCLCCQQSALAL